MVVYFATCVQFCYSKKIQASLDLFGRQIQLACVGVEAGTLGPSGGFLVWVEESIACWGVPTVPIRKNGLF